MSRTVTCSVYETLSQPGVYLEFTGKTKDDYLDTGPVRVYLRRSGMRFAGYATAIEVTYRFEDRHQSLKQRVMPGTEPIAGRGSRTLIWVEFAIVNGAQFFLERQLDGKPLGEMTLEAGDWHVELRRTNQEHRSIDERIESDGAKITHSGTVRRISGAHFRSDEVQDVLSALGMFLSFVAGWWVGIGFVRGKNSKGNLGWQQWGLSRTQPKDTARHSWYHWKLADMLGQVFPGFVRLLQHPTWQAPLGSILYWYNRSNSMAAGVDGSIILTQAAFELLAWHVLVQDSSLLSEENFHALNAEGQIRVLLGHLGIPLAVPSGLVELIKIGKGFNWLCGPQALVAIRNQLVHPAKKRGKAHQARGYPYFEAWLLGQRLLELCILRLCRYDGSYIDRTETRGFPEPTPVPWRAEGGGLP